VRPPAAGRHARPERRPALPATAARTRADPAGLDGKRPGATAQALGLVEIADLLGDEPEAGRAFADQS
jgi:hypothetical protein